MFGELPKLFDRNFAVGFFLPIAIFVTISGVILGPYDFAPNMVSYLATNLLVGTTILGLLSWVGGIVLLAVNRDLYRIMEGYNKFNLIRLFAGFEKRRYRKAIDELEKLDIEYNKCYEIKEEFPVKSRTWRNQLMHQLAEDFPDKEEYLLPTPFGNVLRAFEIYPRVMYGIEGIDGWGRLLAVIPKDYLDLIDTAKAQVDFWLNLGLTFLLLFIEYVSLVEIFRRPTDIFMRSIDYWVVFLFLVLGTIAPLSATSSAREWGDYVKSAFDMFAPKMRKTLAIKEPKDRQEEKLQWTHFSQAIIYRMPEVIPELKKSDKKPVVQRSRRQPVKKHRA